MVSDQQIASLISASNHQKAELIYLHMLVASIFREIPNDMQGRILTRFDKAAEHARGRLLYSEGGDEIAEVFDVFVKNVDKLLD